jgi:hypothetical protein
MAIAVMGGILVATFLTLVVTPALYIGTEEIADLVFRRKRAVQPAPPAGEETLPGETG